MQVRRTGLQLSIQTIGPLQHLGHLKVIGQQSSRRIGAQLESHNLKETICSSYVCSDAGPSNWSSTFNAKVWSAAGSKSSFELEPHAIQTVVQKQVCWIGLQIFNSRRWSAAVLYNWNPLEFRLLVQKHVRRIGLQLSEIGPLKF